MTTPLNPYRPDMPNNDPINGAMGKLKYGVVSGNTTTFVEAPIEQVSYDEDLDTDDITQTSISTPGWKSFLDGLKAATGQLTFVWDALNVPGATGSIYIPFKTRNYVQLEICPDGVSVYGFTALINKFSLATGPKANTVRVTCSYMSTGPVTSPTASQTGALTPMA